MAANKRVNKDGFVWNYRLIQHDDCVGLHAVYYVDGKVAMAGQSIVVGDTVEEIMQALEMMRSDAEKYTHDLLSSFDIPSSGEGDDTTW